MLLPISPYEALQAAVEKAGGQAATARICGVSQPAVWKWVQTAKRIPAEHVMSVEAATGISRHLLRPDIYPPSENHAGDDPGEECDPALSAACGDVAGNTLSLLPRKDVA